MGLNGGRGDFDVWEWDGDEIEVVGGMGDGDLEGSPTLVPGSEWMI